MKPLIYQKNGDYGLSTVNTEHHCLSLHRLGNQGAFYYEQGRWNYERSQNNQTYLTDMSGEYRGIMITKKGRNISFETQGKYWEISLKRKEDIYHMNFIQTKNASFLIFRDVYSYIDKMNPQKEPSHDDLMKFYILKFSEKRMDKYIFNTPHLDPVMSVTNGYLITRSLSYNSEEKASYYLIQLQKPDRLHNLPNVKEYQTSYLNGIVSFNYNENIISIPITARVISVIKESMYINVDFECTKTPELLHLIPHDDNQNLNSGFSMLLSIDFKQSMESYLESKSFEKLAEKGLRAYLSGELSKNFFKELV